MGLRRLFRPNLTLTETLEERLVMSHGGVAAAVAHAHALPTVQNTPSRLGPIGVLGDSYSDEYRFYAPDQNQARNWVEMLHTLRGVNFGPYTLQSRGEPRNQGFAYNWARSGATSDDMVQNQLPGLAAQVRAGDIRYASVFIGGNDFFHVLYGVEGGLIPAAEVPQVLVATEANLEANYATAVNTLLAANPNVRVVVWTLPDISIAPISRQAEATIPATQPLFQAIGQLTLKFNAFVQTLAASSNRVALVDLAAVTNQAAGSPTGTLPFGGTTISLTSTSDDYRSFFLADGLHVGTVGQGIIADSFVQSIDQRFGEQLFPIAPPQIVQYAAQVQQQSAVAGSARFP